MTSHSHPEYVPGCFRCDLSRDEVTAADRPSVPRVGDTISTTEQLDALPSLTIVVDANDEVQQRHGHLATERGDYSAWLGVMPPTCKPSPEVALPVTVLYVPGEPSRPPVTDDARAEANRRYSSATLHSDLTYPAHALESHRRGAFVAGAEWAAGRAETTTATTEDAARLVRQYIDVPFSTALVLAHALADEGLLATARTRPTRDEVSRTISGALARHFEVSSSHLDGITAAADAVLALWADQPTEAEAGARALERAAEQTYTKSNAQWLRDRAARLRAGER